MIFTMNIDLSQVFIKPVVTEKSMSATEKLTYVFEVHPDANKNQIKKAAKEYLKVDVISVNTTKMLGKDRRYGKSMGRTKTWKKALISIKPGQKIELFES